MSESLVAPQSDLVEETAASSAARFYLVSKRKFIILFVATFGLYSTYWLYKQWACHKDATPFDSEEADIWPVMRAIFGDFFIHSLFGQVKQHSKDTALAGWKAGTHATVLVVTMPISSTLDRMAWRNIGSPVTDYLSLAAIAPLLILFYRAQKMINLSCGDPDGIENRKLSAGNYAWIVIGTLCWLLVLAGMLLPDSPPDASSFAGSADSF